MKGIVVGLSSMPPILYGYDENGQLLGEYSNTAAAQAEYVYLDSTPIAVVKSGSPAYIETDHLGTSRQVVDRATNVVLWRWDFLDNTFGANTANASPGGGKAYPFNLRFPGEYFDGEARLHYNYFRDYEAAAGRYVESDPDGLRAGLNTYSYVHNGPIRGRDPLGLDDAICMFNPAICRGAPGSWPAVNVPLCNFQVGLNATAVDVIGFQVEGGPSADTNLNGCACLKLCYSPPGSNGGQFAGAGPSVSIGTVPLGQMMVT